MSNPEDRILALKQLIQHHLTSTGITERIDKALKDQDKDRLITSLSRENVVDHIITELKNTSLSDPVESVENTRVEHKVEATELPSELNREGKRFLQVTIQQGRAFIDDLENSEGASFEIHAVCLGKRVESKKVPAMCDPPFDETFYFCLDRYEKQGSLLTCPSKLQCILVRTNHAGHKQLLGSCSIDWRVALSHTSHHTTNCEVRGTRSDCGVSVGMLSLRLKVLPGVKLAGEVVNSQVGLEADRRLERERLFLMYTKQWWQEYLALRPSHAERLVKIFTEDEQGLTTMVCLLLAPLRSPLIESPRHAVRFVSQIPCGASSAPGGPGNNEQWTSVFATIVANRGDVESHCLVLCSLFLGFYLDSYICIGSKTKGTAHVWVMTLSDSFKPTFWDALTGIKYVEGDTMPYRSIDCVFNDKVFYANTQPSNSISKIRFNIKDPVLWKAVSEDAIHSMRSGLDYPSLQFTLNPNPIDPYHTAATLEYQLKRLVRDERENHDLSTHWNDDLSHLLLPAISAYELERATGVVVSNEDFEDAVRHAVPTGFTFKGYPAQFNHLNIRQIFRDCMRSEVCSDLITSHGDGVEFALKIRIYPYAENVLACWIMFACQYRCIL